MNLSDNKLYIEDLEKICSLPLPWENLRNKTVMISGATGMIGSFLIDVLVHKDININIRALGRSTQKAASRFASYWDKDFFSFTECDINTATDFGSDAPDYIFHAASSTHPKAYSAHPISTVTANIIGTNNLLAYGASKNIKRFVFASTVEIYGENRGDTERFSEDYLGYIDCNTMRAGYPESKRCGEALAQAYIAEKNMDVVLPRLSRTYGPTLLSSDTKALSQFLHKGIAGEDIVLKSEGNQYYSYSYVADAVSGILYVMLLGENGNAYNIADPSSDITLKELAQIIAGYAGKSVVFELPDEAERKGYSTATKALLDSSKLKSLGWKSIYDIRSGLIRTMDILKEDL